MRYTDPLPAQVAAMDKVSVLRLLRVVLGGKFFRRGCALRRRTSQWVWALLARLPDRGRLDSDEVGAVRDLGKRAVLVSISREHVAALCEVLGREQVVAFGLSGVLHEIDGRSEGRAVDGDEEVAGDAPLTDQDGRAVDEDEGFTASHGHERQDAPQVQPDGTGNPAEIDVDPEDGELQAGMSTNEEANPEPQATGTETDDKDEGELEMDIEDGEVSDEPLTDEAKEAAMAAMKQRLLSNLEDMETWEEPVPEPAAEKSSKDAVTDLENMRATVNMILTVAGEFYGQRDLLAFRDPFGGVPFETSPEDE